MLPESKSAILHDINVAIERALIGRSCRSQLFMSENRESRSALLREIQQLIDEKHQITTNLIAQTGTSLHSLLSDPLLKLSKALNIDIDLNGDLTYLLPDVFIELGTALAKNNLSSAILIDDLDKLEPAELGILISALHAANQKSLPVLCIGAGRLQLTKKVGDAKPYAERIFEFKLID